MMQVIRAGDFKQGRWLNGMGVSWDIASDPHSAGTSDFGWRFAIARIDADVPFSRYEKVDRIFTLIEGNGLVLDLEGSGTIIVNRMHAPHAFPGDVPTACRLNSGPCRALNLFLSRERWAGDVKIQKGRHSLTHAGPILLFALDGNAQCDGAHLNAGDAVVTSGSVTCDAGSASLYAALLSAKT